MLLVSQLIVEEITNNKMIPREHYLYQTGYEQVANESNEKYSIDIKEAIKNGWMKQEPTEDGQGNIVTLNPVNGILIAVRGADFPLKCFPDAGAVFAVNLIKAVIIETIKLCAKWYLLPFLLFINKQKSLDAFNRIAIKAISPQLLKDYCLTDFSKELKKFIFSFLCRIGFTTESSETFVTIIANIMDYDNVYRLRLEDTFSETNKYKLYKNPRKEIARLLRVMKLREVRPGGKGEAIHFKFKSVAWLLSLSLLIPKIKRAFCDSLESIDFSKLQYDEIDMYWTCMRNDYLWLGLTDQERKDFAINKGWKFPEPIKQNGN